MCSGAFGIFSLFCLLLCLLTHTPKPQPLGTGTELSLGNSFGEVGGNSFPALPSEGETMGSCPGKLCVRTWQDLGRSFTAVVQVAKDQCMCRVCTAFVWPQVVSWWAFVVIVQLPSCVSLRPHGLQHSRLPCPSSSPGVSSNPCPLSWWCHPTISSSVILFSSCPQSFPATGSFPMSRRFASRGQSTGASASVLWRLSNCDLLWGEERWHLPLGVFLPWRGQRYCYMYPMRGNQDRVPRLHSCLLAAPPLSLHPLPSLIAAVQICPLELTEGCGGWRLFPTNKKQETLKVSMSRSPTGSCSVSAHRRDLWSSPGPAVLSLQLFVSFCAARPGHF